MSNDPFAALEEAVGAVEQTAARLTGQRESLQNRLEDQTARAETLQDAKRNDRDGDDRIEMLEREREAIRTRLRRVRDRLAVTSLTTPESPSS